MIRFLAFVLILTPFSLLDAGDVAFEKSGDDIVVTIGGEEFSRYHTSSQWKKPFFDPVVMGGTKITRPIDPNEKEHPHHKGIWVSVDEVNTIDYWGEHGDIKNVSAKWSTAACGDEVGGTLMVVNHWLDDAKKTVVIEETSIHIAPNKLLTYDITFKAPGHKVEFLDTKEGLLGFRMAHTMRESEGGRVLGANGKKGTKENWGQPNKWIDYIGEVDGKTFGVTLMDHPDNLRPSRYHVRNYGLFSISPLGDKAYTQGKEPAKPVHLKPGEKFSLRYGIYFHEGDTNAGEVEKTYKQFLAQ
ncbi:MAG: PmoA family protein [Planctomycetaceae bacterium]|jgi:hypothetical protein|nr:PmoA family protein [Planctomycetaceae bacterium]MDG2388571.1 PmoA family protein [Planctomycetaceae bacterium]